MSDGPQPAELEVRPASRPLLSRLSVVWLVPLVALLVSLGVAWQTYRDRGVLVEIAFDDATGIQPGQTPLKFREVDVGRVEGVRFSDDLSQVVVSVRVQNDVAPFIDDDARFWLVRPEITTRGVSRLDTVLSGVFIEGLWDSETGPVAERYTALSSAPVERETEGGTWVRLRMDDGGQLAEGAPVLYRGVEVGQVSNKRLSDDGVVMDAFIRAPHDARLSSATRFWDVSGFSVSLGAQGLRLDVRSLPALVSGGVEFDTLVSGGALLEGAREFRLYGGRDAAREAVLSDGGDDAIAVSVLLDGDIRGLARDAEVRYRGLRVGRVRDFSLQVEESARGARDVRLRVEMTLWPARFGLRPDTTYAEGLAFLEERVAEGLRARAASTGLLGGTVVIELVETDDRAEGRIDYLSGPLPRLPSAPAEITDPADTAEGVFARINDLPVEELMQSAIALLDDTRAVVGRESTRRVPDAALELIEEMQAIATSEGVQRTPAAMRDAAEDLQAIMARLREEGMSQRLLSAIDETGRAASATARAANELPPILDNLESLAAKVNALPLADLTQRANGLLASLDALLGSDEMAALPERLNSTLGQLRGALAELREGGAVGNVNEALAAARRAATSVETASDRLPELLRRIESTVTGAEELVAAYGDRSDFNDQALSALRELRRAAASAASLARTLERDPSAIIRGR